MGLVSRRQLRARVDQRAIFARGPIAVGRRYRTLMRSRREGWTPVGEEARARDHATHRSRRHPVDRGLPRLPPAARPAPVGLPPPREAGRLRRRPAGDPPRPREAGPVPGRDRGRVAGLAPRHPGERPGGRGPAVRHPGARSRPGTLPGGASWSGRPPGWRACSRPTRRPRASGPSAARSCCGSPTPSPGCRRTSGGSWSCTT